MNYKKPSGMKNDCGKKERRRTGNDRKTHHFNLFIDGTTVILKGHNK